MSLWLTSVVINTILKGFIFWGLIKLFDRDNTRNTLSLAFFIGFLMSIPVAGIFCLIALGFLLIQYYELDIGQMIVVIILLLAAQWGIARLILFFYNSIQ